MCQATELKNVWEKSQERLELAKQNLEKSVESSTTLQAAAQELNEAWLDFKKAHVELNNHLTLKKLGELYGC